LGHLPYGYDHKYIYDHIGYNLKMTDMQAAIGVAQIAKLTEFVKLRKRNWQILKDGLETLTDFFVLPEPTEYSDPSWFGFAISVRSEAPFERKEFTDFLESRKIATRLLFGGNLARQPAYLDLPYRIVGDLCNSDFVMKNTLWLGVYPGLTIDMMNYVVDSVHEFSRSYGEGPYFQ